MEYYDSNVLLCNALHPILFTGFVVGTGIVGITNVTDTTGIVGATNVIGIVGVGNITINTNVSTIVTGFFSCLVDHK